MKTFTCREMGGTCDEAFSGETAQEIADKGGGHIMASNDEGHADIKNQMANSTEEQKNAWMDDFQAKFDAKAEV